MRRGGLGLALAAFALAWAQGAAAQPSPFPLAAWNDPPRELRLLRERVEAGDVVEVALGPAELGILTLGVGAE